MKLKRLRTGKIARHQRLPRDQPLFYKDWEIPAGVSFPRYFLVLF